MFMALIYCTFPTTILDRQRECEWVKINQSRSASKFCGGGSACIWAFQIVIHHSCLWQWYARLAHPNTIEAKTGFAQVEEDDDFGFISHLSCKETQGGIQAPFPSSPHNRHLVR
uniref:Uncharacterized protein n=1 Tax=Sphaerodactylus townsendi TaxID=933632 RepID=A0ACB8EYJ6_9SAUR